MPSPEMTYADAACEVRTSGEIAVVFDRARGKYLRTMSANLPAALTASMTPIRTTFTMAAATSTIALTIGLLALNLVVLGHHPTEPTRTGITVTAIYLLASIAIHELAHIVVLRSFGRRPDRIGVKLNYWVFPAVYVRMNQSLMLARAEQIGVHIAGLLANLLVNTALLALNRFWLHDASITLALQVAFIAIAWNVVPVLHSDGYRVLLALANAPAARGFRANPWWVVLLKLGSAAFAAIAFIRFISAILRGVHG